MPNGKMKESEYRKAMETKWGYTPAPWGKGGVPKTTAAERFGRVRTGEPTTADYPDYEPRKTQFWQDIGRWFTGQQEYLADRPKYRYDSATKTWEAYYPEEELALAPEAKFPPAEFPPAWQQQYEEFLARGGFKKGVTPEGRTTREWEAGGQLEPFPAEGAPPEMVEAWKGYTSWFDFAMTTKKTPSYITETVAEFQKLPYKEIPADVSANPLKKKDWLERNAYAFTVEDETGNVVSGAIAVNLKQYSPETPVTKIYYMGEGKEERIETTIGEIEIRAGTTPTGEYLETPVTVGLGGLELSQAQIEETQAARDAEIKTIEDSDMSYNEKLSALSRLRLKYAQIEAGEIGGLPPFPTTKAITARFGPTDIPRGFDFRMTPEEERRLEEEGERDIWEARHPRWREEQAVREGQVASEVEMREIRARLSQLGLIGSGGEIITPSAQLWASLSATDKADLRRYAQTIGDYAYLDILERMQGMRPEGGGRERWTPASQWR